MVIAVIEYTRCSDDASTYSFDNNPTIQKTYLGAACTPAFTASMTTPGDYITIEGSGSSCGDATASRYCGAFFSSVNENLADTPICDCTSPFFVGVRFDNLADAKSSTGGVASNRGFCLNYRQVPC